MIIQFPDIFTFLHVHYYSFLHSSYSLKWATITFGGEKKNNIKVLPLFAIVSALCSFSQPSRAVEGWWGGGGNGALNVQSRTEQGGLLVKNSS